MNEKALRAKLLQLREQLRATQETGDRAAATVELDQTRVGRLSRMDAMRAQAMSVEARRRREEKLRAIDSALTRMDAGYFGDCLDCGEAIAVARIEYDPAATTCIKCATKAEN